MTDMLATDPSEGPAMTTVRYSTNCETAFVQSLASQKPKHGMLVSWQSTSNRLPPRQPRSPIRTTDGFGPTLLTVSLAI